MTASRTLAAAAVLLALAALGWNGADRVVTDVAHDDVPAYLNAMDVLCVPSRTTPAWREQFGRMLIEAMAHGVPVVASRSGEIPHVVGDAGVTLPEDDAAAWTATIGGLLADDDGRAALGRAGLARARSVFPWPVIARAHLDFFNSVLSAPSSTPGTLRTQ